ncbi:endolytic transglycosylase MltG [Paenibacillus agri]|uniref:Endolytic transglycosylase MltG n=1 Tax=Paenibacillus agri TaxID=2744309 RepID=A0A850ERL6_9BACL|nr:endolytic transglycosylase MltG [Paenibacillus agri]NUU61392.1 endolytic transglycosylase MltG [Paenibacillus agri]
MKNRSFLLGLGSGLVAGALLLQVMISGNAAPLTKEQVLKGAAQLNLKVSDESGKLLTPGESALEVQPGSTEGPLGEAGDTREPVSTEVPAVMEASPPPSAPATAVVPSPAATPKATEPSTPAVPSSPAEEIAQQPKDTGTPDVPEQPETPKSPKPEVVTVRIPSGITLTRTADLLAQSGAVKDKEAFLKSAKERKINTKIQYGTYSFEKGESIDSIIEKLITLKK